MNVIFKITGVRNSKGKVRGLAFQNSEGFPERVSQSVARVQSPAKEGTTVLTFRNIQAESLAFAFYHDEEELGRIKKGFLGIPKCGVSASNWNGRSRPTFKKCLVSLSPTLTARMKYL